MNFPGYLKRLHVLPLSLIHFFIIFISIRTYVQTGNMSVVVSAAGTCVFIPTRPSPPRIPRVTWAITACKNQPGRD